MYIFTSMKQGRIFCREKCNSRHTCKFPWELFDCAFNLRTLCPSHFVFLNKWLKGTSVWIYTHFLCHQQEICIKPERPDYSYWKKGFLTTKILFTAFYFQCYFVTFLQMLNMKPENDKNTSILWSFEKGKRHEKEVYPDNLTKIWSKYKDKINSLLLIWILVIDGLLQ